MIHKFKMNDYKIVIDVASGAVHVVDEIVFDILNSYDSDGNYKPSEKQHCPEATADESIVEEAIAEIEELKKEGLLFSREIKMPMQRKPVVKALCLHVAHDCNLRCNYCFAGEGNYHGGRGLMSAEIGKSAIDLLIDSSGNRKNLEVDFFGGEPLLNFDVVKAVVEYGRKVEKSKNKNIRFTLTTNAALLNEEIQDYVNRHMHNVVLSLDGRPEVNDRLRKHPNGKGSYELVTPKIMSLAKSRNHLNYYVRGTYTRHNLDFSRDVMHLADLGFKQISVEPVVAPPDSEYALRHEDITELCREYDDLALQILNREKPFNFFHFMIDLTGGPCIAKRMSGCGAGVEYLAVTPEGILYPCHQFVGIPEFKMGDVLTGITNTEVYDLFNGCNIDSKPECKECWAKLYCSGGCAANSYNTHGDILRTYELGCILQRRRVECAIMMYVHKNSWI